jgi:hypothetical protein
MYVSVMNAGERASEGAEDTGMSMAERGVIN